MKNTTKLTAADVVFKIDKGIPLPKLAPSNYARGLRIISREADVKGKIGHTTVTGYAAVMGRLEVGDSFLVQKDLIYPSTIGKAVRPLAEKSGKSFAYVKFRDGNMRIWRLPATFGDDSTDKAGHASVARHSESTVTVDECVNKFADTSRVGVELFDAKSVVQREVYERAIAYGNERSKACLYEDNEDLSTDRAAIMSSFVAGAAHMARILREFDSCMDGMHFGKLNEKFNSRKI